MPHGPDRSPPRWAQAGSGLPVRRHGLGTGGRAMATAVAAGGQAKGAPVPWLIAPVVALAAFMEVLDIAIANVALQHIAGNLGASGDEATWVLTSYLVTNAIVLPVSGWLATVVGRKRFFMMCIAGFSAASLLCGMAPTLTVLILCRALQGLTGGGLQPLAQAILADAFPPAQRGIAFGFYGMAVVAAPAIGPTPGGWITDNLDWRWVFLINVPVGAVLLLLAQRMVHDPPALVAERARRLREGVRIDYIGFALLTLGLGTLQVVLDRGQQDDWFGSSFITACALVSLVAVLYFVAWELASDDPIVDLRLLANRNFATANLLMFMLGFILLGSTALLPQLVQTLMGYTATQAGMVLSPGGFAIIFLMPVVGQMVTKVDPRLMIAGGLVVCSAALWRMSGFTLGVDYRTVAEARIVQAVGLAFLFIPISTTAYVGLPPGKSNNASALITVAQPRRQRRDLAADLTAGPERAVPPSAARRPHGRLRPGGRG